MRYTVFDVETPNYANNRMSAIGIVIMEDDRIVEHFYSLVDPQARFDPFNIALTGITPEMVADAPSFDVLWPRIKKYMDDAVLVAHNAQFDMAVLSKCLRDYGIYWRDTAAYICTCKMGRSCLPGLENHKLSTLSDYYGIELDHHQADSDALACARILQKLRNLGEEKRFLRQYDLLAGRTITPGRAKGCGGHKKHV